MIANLDSDEVGTSIIKTVRDHAIVGKTVKEYLDTATDLKAIGIDELILYPIAPSDAVSEQKSILETIKLFAN